MSASSVADRIGRIPDPQEPDHALALPTAATFGLALLAWIGSTALGATGTWPWPLSTAVNAVAAYALFTVAHDASHNSLSTSEAVTTWLGRVSLALFAPQAGFRTWRYIHMQHHRFTNEQDGSDPDQYTHAGPRWQLPLRWATIDLWYIAFYVRHLSTRPRRDRIELAVTWLVLGGVLLALVLTGHVLAALAYWLIPARLAVIFLAFSFDWLPHHGLERHTAQSDRFKATRNRIGAERLLGLALLNQNYHLVHHLHPRIPFYRYVAVWRRGEAAYLDADPALSTVGGRPLSPDEYRELRVMETAHH